MNKLVILIFGIVILGKTVSAQESKFGVDSVKTIENASIYMEYYKHKDYKEALPAWRYLFLNAPKFQLNTYIRGEDIIEHMYKTTNDKAYFDTLMMVYDQWIENFGDHPRLGKGHALGKKGTAQYRHKGQDLEMAKEAYTNLTKSVELEGVKSHPVTINFTYIVGNNLFKKNAISRDEYVNLYMKLTKLVEAKQDLKAEDREKLQEGFDNMFYNSGAADCETLEKLLGAKFEEVKNDKEELINITRLLKRGECTGSELYAKVAEASYRIDPSAEAASNLSVMFLKRGENDKAQEYMVEAVSKSTDPAERSELNLRLAQFKLIEKRYAESKRYALEALKDNSRLGEAYKVIGQAYGLGGQSISEDSFERGAAFWAAVDKLNQAKQVDPSLANEVNALIKAYTPHFPNKEEGFFRGIQAGQSFKVGGWINETTTVRYNN